MTLRNFLVKSDTNFPAVYLYDTYENYQEDRPFDVFYRVSNIDRDLLDTEVDLWSVDSGRRLYVLLLV